MYVHHTELKSLFQPFLPHLTEVSTTPRASLRIGLTQEASVQLPKPKYSFRASKILDEQQLPNWLASGEQPALCQAIEGLASLQYLQTPEMRHVSPGGRFCFILFFIEN